MSAACPFNATNCYIYRPGFEKETTVVDVNIYVRSMGQVRDSSSG